MYTAMIATWVVGHVVSNVFQILGHSDDVLAASRMATPDVDSRICGIMFVEDISVYICHRDCLPEHIACSGYLKTDVFLPSTGWY